jgi:predicted transglutaminase-like cysteine proteinase
VWQLVRRIIGVWALAALVLAGARQAAHAIVASTELPPLLFGSLEFRGISGGGWYDFPAKVAEMLDLLSRCGRSPGRCPNPDVLALLDDTAGLSIDRPYEALAAVHRLGNRRPYRSDLVNFDAREHWASPLEYLDRSGDCEDSAIFKYALLRHLGLPADALRIVLLKRKADDLGHAVLAAYLEDRVYILDSLGDTVRPQSEVTDYWAVFSFNETSRWAHIVGSTQGGAPSMAGPADSPLFLQLYRAAIASAGPEGGGYRVQLGAFRSLENADRLWQSVWRAQWDLLAGSMPQIESLERPAGGQLHLLQIGALGDLDTAQSLCRRLSARGIDCLVVEPSGPAPRRT